MQLHLTKTVSQVVKTPLISWIELQSLSEPLRGVIIISDFIINASEFMIAVVNTFDFI